MNIRSIRATKNTERKYLLFCSYSTLAVFLITIFMVISTSSAKALSGSQFNAGRIIDDAIFYNSSSMSVNQIQAFLNSKVPTCDTNGTQLYSGSTTRGQYGAAHGHPPPYTCLKSYSQTIPSVINSGSDLCGGSISGGTKSSAQLIYDVSRACDINPQVMIVLLQKEQSLVTDSWPWSIQYRSATGYGCPDTAPCDSQYYGFFNQLYQAAQAYKRYAANPTDYNYRYGRNNTILWNPSSACGTSTVYIQNQATASLYIYTPYRPNQAALNNLYGTGDSCSSYGNRNFWRLFNDWFGPTLGPLIRTSSSANLYYSDGEKKYLVGSMNIANQYGLGLNDVRYVSQSEINRLSTGTTLTQLVKSSSDSDEDGSTLYLVSNGKKFPISSMSQLTNFGFDSNKITMLPLKDLSRTPTNGSYLSSFVQGSSRFVYKIEMGNKRGVFDLNTLEAANPSGNISRLSEYTLSQLSLSDPYITGDAIMHSPDGKVWLYQNSNWMYVPSSGVYDCWNLSLLKNYEFSITQAKVGHAIGNLSCLVKKSDGSKYMLNKTNKITIDPSWGLNPSILALDRTIDRVGSNLTLPGSTVFKTQSSSTLYILENGKKRPVASMVDLFSLGYSTSNIKTVSEGIVGSITTGVTKYASGTLVNNRGKLYIILGNGRLYIPSASTFNAFGFAPAKVITINDTTADAYPASGNLKVMFKVHGSAYFVSNKRLWTIPSSLESSYPITSIPSYNLHLLYGLNGQSTATAFIKSEQGSTIYFMDGGYRRPVSSWSKLSQLGGANKIVVLGSAFINILPLGSQI